jgi:glycosyltransferase involved in cell wall biosynthesis
MTNFAVVIPVHNKERHVKRAVLSVIEQTYPPSEIIIIDDCSHDASIERIREIGDRRLRFFRRDVPGPGGYAARNLGIEQAQSDWIAFLDADDAWEPEHLADMHKAIQADDSDSSCVFSGYRYVAPGGGVGLDWFTRRGKAAGGRSTDRMLGEWLDGGCPLWTGAVAMRRQVLIDAGLFPAGKCRRGGDRDLWMRVILRTGCIYTGSPTATYFRDSDNMVTASTGFTLRQPLLDTVADAAMQASPQRAAVLRRIFNREAFMYSQKAWKNGERINPSMYEGYTISENPAKYATILLMQAIPIGRQLRSLVRLTKSLRVRPPPASA